MAHVGGEGVRGIAEDGEARAPHLGGERADELRRGKGPGRRAHERLGFLRRDECRDVIDLGEALAEEGEQLVGGLDLPDGSQQVRLRVD